MSVLTREQILENRRKVIEFLKQPERKKAIGHLEDRESNEKRCCLGHMCHALDLPRTVRDGGRVAYDGDCFVAPHAAMVRLGLNSDMGAIAGEVGHFGFGFEEGKIFVVEKERGLASTLAGLNDGTKATPQNIAEYLESVIEGGEKTPWRALSSYGAIAS